MFRPRIIPVLLLQNGGLVKSVKFKNKKYVGDPINAVRIFNDFKVDEIVLLDTQASMENRTISFELLKEVSEEANMPFSVGGGIKDLKSIEQLIKSGAERVILNTHALKNPDFISEAAKEFGSSTITVCIDYKKNFWGKNTVYTTSGKISTGRDPISIAKLMEQNGAGEIIIQSIDKDGTMTGYDLAILAKIGSSVHIPVVALGGVGNASHIEEGYKKGLATGLAAGSFFVFKGKMKGVLIQYPEVKTYNFAE
jgi:imidazole glycerol-phosphate synthase subunit HisF